MEPMPETREALAEFVTLDDPDVDELLAELGRSAHAIVPDLVGLSLGLAHEGLTFTLAGLQQWRGGIDAAQYVDGGPCVEVTEGRTGLGRGRHGRPDGRGALAALLPGQRGLWGRQQPVAARSTGTTGWSAGSTSMPREATRSPVGRSGWSRPSAAGQPRR